MLRSIVFLSVCTLHPLHAFFDAYAEPSPSFESVDTFLTYDTTRTILELGLLNEEVDGSACDQMYTLHPADAYKPPLSQYVMPHSSPDQRQHNQSSRDEQLIDTLITLIKKKDYGVDYIRRKMQELHLEQHPTALVAAIDTIRTHKPRSTRNEAILTMLKLNALDCKTPLMCTYNERSQLDEDTDQGQGQYICRILNTSLEASHAFFFNKDFSSAELSSGIHHGMFHPQMIQALDNKFEYPDFKKRLNDIKHFITQSEKQKALVSYHYPKGISNPDNISNLAQNMPQKTRNRTAAENLFKTWLANDPSLGVLAPEIEQAPMQSSISAPDLALPVHLSEITSVPYNVPPTASYAPYTSVDMCYAIPAAQSLHPMESPYQIPDALVDSLIYQIITCGIQYCTAEELRTHILQRITTWPEQFTAYREYVQHVINRPEKEESLKNEPFLHYGSTFVALIADKYKMSYHQARDWLKATRDPQVFYTMIPAFQQDPLISETHITTAKLIALDKGINLSIHSFSDHNPHIQYPSSSQRSTISLNTSAKAVDVFFSDTISSELFLLGVKHGMFHEKMVCLFATKGYCASMLNRFLLAVSQRISEEQYTTLCSYYTACMEQKDKPPEERSKVYIYIGDVEKPQQKILKKFHTQGFLKTKGHTRIAQCRGPYTPRKKTSRFSENEATLMPENRQETLPNTISE